MIQPVKQIIIIRKDLKMRTGKIAAQSAHASMKVLLDMMQYSHAYHPEVDYGMNSWALMIADGSPIVEWLQGSFTKICVSVDSEKELDEIYAKAQEAKLPCSIIVDSGKTEFNGVPTKTAVAIGPYYSDQIDKITGYLKLL